MEEKKLIGFVVERKDGEDPVAFVGEDKEKLLEKVNLFVEKIGGEIYKVEEVDAGDRIGTICFAEIKDGKPVRIVRTDDDPGEGYWLCHWNKI